MNIIFSIEGGLGKSIMGTAVLKAIKNQYPKKLKMPIQTQMNPELINTPWPA